MCARLLFEATLDRNGLAIMSILPAGAETSRDRFCPPAIPIVAGGLFSNHRALGLGRELADRLHQVVRLDYLACVLHDATSEANWFGDKLGTGLPV
jgi:hypothetical protein